MAKSPTSANGGKNKEDRETRHLKGRGNTLDTKRDEDCSELRHGAKNWEGTPKSYRGADWNLR